MALYTLPTLPVSPAVGDAATAAWADEAAQWISYLANPALYLAFQSPAQSIPNAAWTTLAPDTPATDTYGGWNSSYLVYYAQVQGFYRATARVTFAANGTGVRGIAIGWNGSVPDSAAEIVAGATSQSVEVSSTRYLAQGQYVRFLAYQSSGAALNTGAGGSEFVVQWVHQ